MKTEAELKLKRVLDFVLPQGWRARKKPTPELNDAVMAVLNEQNPVYRALMDEAHNRLATCVQSSQVPALQDSERAYWCGAAAALGNYIIRIENWRDQAVSQRQREEQQRQRKT